MGKNLARHEEAYELRRQGLSFVEIGRQMGITGQRASQLARLTQIWINRSRNGPVTALGTTEGAEEWLAALKSKPDVMADDKIVARYT